MLQLVKSLPFHIPGLSKRYPFLAEPSRKVHYMEYPHPSGCTPSNANHIKSLDNSTATVVLFLNKVALEKLRHLDTSVMGWQSKPRHRHTEIRFCCFKSLKSLKNKLSYWASTSAVVGWQSKPRHRHTEIRFSCFKSLKNRLSYRASISAIINNIINKLHAAKVSWMTTSLYKTLSFRLSTSQKGVVERGGGISDAHLWHILVRTCFQDY